MTWECPDDGSTNNAFKCIVCGRPRVAEVPILISLGRVLEVPTADGLIFGSGELAHLGDLQGVSRRHARVFFDMNLGSWVIVNLSETQELYVNGDSITCGSRREIRDSDLLRLGPVLELKVEIRELSGPVY